MLQVNQIFWNSKSGFTNSLLLEFPFLFQIFNFLHSLLSRGATAQEELRPWHFMSAIGQLGLVMHCGLGDQQKIQTLTHQTNRKHSRSNSGKYDPWRGCPQLGNKPFCRQGAKGEKNNVILRCKGTQLSMEWGNQVNQVLRDAVNCEERKRLDTPHVDSIWRKH